MKLKILSSNNIRQVISMRQAIDCVREAFIQLSTRKAEMPLRTVVSVQPRGGTALFMPAYLMSSDALGAKIVTVFPENSKSNLPIIHAIVVIINTETGQPMAIMDGTYLTALRTGAASGVATELMARTGASMVAILGAGVQARTQLEAVCTVHAIDKVLVYDCVQERAESYVKEMKVRGSPIPERIFVAESPTRAVRNADIICTATTSTTPVFNDGDLKKGVHINSVGSYTPQMQEVPAPTVSRAKVVVDSRSASLAEAGDLIVPLKDGIINTGHIHGEIGEVAAGKIPGRESEDEITFFKSVGLAVQDVAVAEFIRQRSEEQGVGTDVEL